MTNKKANRLCERVLGYRIFSDARRKNEPQRAAIRWQCAGGFTVHAGGRYRTWHAPRGFSKGASPERAEALYEYFVERCRQQEMNTQTGRFAADMQVSLVNDGPVTFWLQV